LAIFIFMSSPLMKIPVDDIPESPKEIKFSENLGALNEADSKDRPRDFRFPRLLDVNLIYYRSGRQIFFQGSLKGSFEGYCSRCLGEYGFTLANAFEFVLSPAPSKSNRKIEELSREDLGLSYYSTDEIDLTPLILEQVMLALPTRPLCDESCRGLCGGCGANLNHEACVCSANTDDPRMAIFRTLKVGH
jgi:uncharacterized protein